MRGRIERDHDRRRRRRCRKCPQEPERGVTREREKPVERELDLSALDHFFDGHHVVKDHMQGKLGSCDELMQHLARLEKKGVT